ncbi:MAG: hypothetical protein HOU01_18840 [Streptomycetaceae bacterium]|nr:hypothetical protein [Streptomycetaceae bacterium]
MTALTGCLGKDDKKSNASSSSSPSASASDDATGKSTASPTGKSTSTKKPTGNPTATGSDISDSVKRIDLKVGDCVTYEGEKTTKVSCSTPHDEEAGAIYTLPDSMSPMSLTFKQDIGDKCQDLLEPIISRQANPDKYAIGYIYPSSSSWMMDNDRTLQCMVAGANNTKLTAKLK